jgi:hypothetical protein
LDGAFILMPQLHGPCSQPTHSAHRCPAAAAKCLERSSYVTPIHASNQRNGLYFPGKTGSTRVAAITYTFNGRRETAGTDFSSAGVNCFSPRFGTWGILCNSVASNATYLEEETKDYARHFFGDGSSFQNE